MIIECVRCGLIMFSLLHTHDWRGAIDTRPTTIETWRKEYGGINEYFQITNNDRNMKKGIVWHCWHPYVTNAWRAATLRNSFVRNVENNERLIQIYTITYGASLVQLHQRCTISCTKVAPTLHQSCTILWCKYGASVVQVWCKFGAIVVRCWCKFGVTFESSCV